MSDNPNYSQAPGQEIIQTSTLAIVSLVTGILSWFLLPIIGAVIAVITGHMARNEIRRSNGMLAGDGMAVAGLILGYLHLALVLIGICVVGLLILLGFGIFGINFRSTSLLLPLLF